MSTVLGEETNEYEELHVSGATSLPLRGVAPRLGGVAARRTRRARRRESDIAKEHHVQWSLEECRRIVSLHFRVVHASSLTFLPFVPMLWRALLPLADRVGPLFLPRSGGNTFIVARRP